MITGENHKVIMPVSIILFLPCSIKNGIIINLSPGRHLNISFTSTVS